MLAMTLTVSLLAGSGIGQPPAAEPKPAPLVREFSAKLPPPKPLTVSDVIGSLSLDEAKASFIGEPTGKPRMLVWSRVKLPGTDAEVDVAVQLGDTIWSANMGKAYPDVPLGRALMGKWDVRLLRDATVLKVTISPPQRRD